MRPEEVGAAFGGAHVLQTDAIEWPTVAIIAVCYGIWAACGLWLWPIAPLAALIIMGVMAALHSSLVHECLHGHPTRKASINEALVALPLGLVWPYRRFKTLHLRHHADERLTDPFDDPESYYKALWVHEALPRWLKLVLRVNSTLAGRMVLNPLLGTWGLIAMDARLMAQGDRGVMDAWARHLAGAFAVIAIVHFWFEMPLWLYVLVPCWLGQSIIAVRTYAEHQWHEDPQGRTLIVERSMLSILFLNNNLHLVHHRLPRVAWYRLPRIFSEHREVWLAQNGGYVFPNYFALMKAYLIKGKEPVVHPILRRDK